MGCELKMTELGDSYTGVHYPILSTVIFVCNFLNFCKTTFYFKFVKTQTGYSEKLGEPIGTIITKQVNGPLTVLVRDTQDFFQRQDC